MPTYIAFLDSKAAFDVVIHANLIRRLFQTGFTYQSILMIESLYDNATSCVKWKGQFSEKFKIEQGVRQGGAMSADLYKVYVNPLLDSLANIGLGGHIGNIYCCAPTCADDVALISNNPVELQMMINIAANFSRQEGYMLQPTKSVVLPIKSTKTVNMGSEFWSINGNHMPVVANTAHIGIQKSEKSSVKLTVEENIKKARRTLYSLMGTGLHGTNGLDPETKISLLKTYVLPILTYGLEIVIPTGKNLDCVDLFYKKTLKQILNLPIQIADPAVYIVSGLLPVEAEIHLKILSTFGNICRAKTDSIEWRLADRQLTLKSFDSHSWFIDLKKICIKYNILECHQFLQNPMKKTEWKSMVKKRVHGYWINNITTATIRYSTLENIGMCYHIGKIHPLIATNSACIRDTRKIPARIRLATGTYNLQKNQARLLYQISANYAIPNQKMYLISF